MSLQNNPYAPPLSEVNGAKVQAEPKDKIEVTYSHTYLEIVWDRFGLYWRNPIFAILFVVVAFGLPLSDSFDRAGHFHAEYFLPMAGQGCLIFLVGGLLINLLITGLSTMRGSSEPVYGPFRLELSDEGLTRETSTERLLIKWRGIIRIRKSARHIRIYQTPNAYVLLPRRAFTLEQDGENFYLTAKRYLEEAKATFVKK